MPAFWAPSGPQPRRLTWGRARARQRAQKKLMLCMLAMRNKGLKGKYKETGVTESERNESQRKCTKMKMALERNRDAGKCKNSGNEECE